jgi:hypothetical protein
MALVSIQPIKDLTLINVEYVHEYYPKDISEESKIFFIISRVFNDRLKSVDINFDIPFEREVYVESAHYSRGHYLKIGDIVEKYHIAKGYYLEVIIRYVSNAGKLKTIFPGEIRYHNDPNMSYNTNTKNAFDNITTITEAAVKSLIDRLEPHEITTKLSSLNYSIISEDLVHSMKRYNSGDFDGSIKFSRKVVEGIKQLKIDEIVKESN